MVSDDELMEFIKHLYGSGFLIALGPSNTILVNNLFDQVLPDQASLFFKEHKASIIRYLQQERYPATASQKKIWLESQLRLPQTYHIIGAYQLRGSLDVALFRSCLRDIVRHNSIFSAKFIEEQGQLFVRETNEEQVFLKVKKVANCSEAQKELSTDFNQPFHLETDPLYRFSLYELGDDQYVFSICIHHLIFDDESKKIFVEQLLGQYRHALKNDAAPSYRAENIPFKYYALWRSCPQQSLTQHSFWQEQLQKHQPLHVPAFAVDPHNQHARVLTYTLNARTQERIEQYIQENDISLFMFFVALINLLCHRYTDNSTVTLSTPYANRPSNELFHSMGYFLDTLYIISELDPEMTLARYIADVKELCLRSYQHALLPIDDTLKDDPSLKQSLNKIRLVCVEDELDEFSMPGLSLRPIKTQLSLSKFDFLIKVIQGKQLKIQLEYNQSIARSMISFLAHNGAELIDLLLNNPQCTIANTKKPSAKDLRYYEHVNSMRAAHIAPVASHYWQALMQEYASAPDKARLIYQEQSLSSVDIQHFIATFNSYLDTHHSSPISSIAFYLEDKLQQALVCLAAIALGCTYIPLDNEDSSKRILTIISDSQPDVIITDEYLVSHLSASAGSQLIMISNVLAHSSQKPMLNLDNCSSILYRIYTSGSTGKPKGVDVSHKAFLTYVDFARRTVYANPDIVSVACQASLSFDFSLTVFLAALLLGKTVVLVNKEDFLEPERFVQTIDRYAINLIKITPSYFKAFSSYLIANSSLQLASLSTIVFGGEKVSSKLVKAWQQQMKHKSTLLNHYGPTEAVVGVMSAPIKSDDSEVALGRLRADVSAFLLASEGSLCPVGAAGELYLCSDYLAEGYYHDPQLTATVFNASSDFIAHSLHLQGSRVYKTGDRVVLNSSGQFIFIERIDDNLKIKGYRVSLNEIKQAVLSHADVVDCVLFYDEKEALGICLAYVVGEFTVSPEELAHYLSLLLPVYMLPQHLLLVESIPMNANGKISRESLLQRIVQKNNARVIVPPDNEIHRHLHAIVERGFGNRVLSVDDNFYALGGSSILAMELIAAFHQANFHIELHDFFHATTLLEIYCKTIVLSPEKEAR